MSGSSGRNLASEGDQYFLADLGEVKDAFTPAGSSSWDASGQQDMIRLIPTSDSTVRIFRSALTTVNVDPVVSIFYMSSFGVFILGVQEALMWTAPETLEVFSFLMQHQSGKIIFLWTSLLIYCV